MIICQNCNTENPENSMFCQDCGEEITAAQSATDATTTEESKGDSQTSLQVTVQVVEEESDQTDDINTEPVVTTLYLPDEKEIDLREGDVHIISRLVGGHPDATIKIDDEGISSAGIKVEAKNGKVFVTDLGGGAVVVGNIVPVNEEFELRDGGLISSGTSNIIAG